MEIYQFTFSHTDTHKIAIYTKQTSREMGKFMAKQQLNIQSAMTKVIAMILTSLSNDNIWATA